jgi:hypothetical protein
VTLVMFPVLVYMYRRLATAEDRDVRRQFGAIWDAYAAATPRFIPRLDRGAVALDSDAGTRLSPERAKVSL